MGGIELVLVMMAAVVISGVLVNVLPIAIPTPLVQIGLGALSTARTRTSSAHASRRQKRLC